MSARDPGTSRWRHLRAALGRQARGRGKDTIAIAVLLAAAIVMTLGIFIQQKATLPPWVPFVGQEFAHVTGEFTTAQAVTPGQGQAVDIAGIQVGKVTSVHLEDGRAVVGMGIEPKYLRLIHPDATLLLRPKTGLNDMVVAVDPGKAKGHIEAGANFPLSRTEPNINLEQFLAVLDGDTRQYLQLLLASGARGIGGRGRQLSGALRRLQPFAHYVAQLNRAVAQRRRALARVIHDLSLLTTELGRHDAQIRRFVTSSDEALGDFANQQQSIQELLIEFPATLAAMQTGLASANRFSTAARPALLGLIPQARALSPALVASRRLFKRTTVPIRDQIRPFTRQIRPVLTHLKQGSSDLEKTVSGLGNSLGSLNSLFNELAYRPQGSRQSFLFYLPWLGHNFNAGFNLSDAGGPVLRGLVMISCTGTSLAYGLAETKPFLKTLLQGANIPRARDLPPVPADPSSPTISCGPEP